MEHCRALVWIKKMRNGKLCKKRFNRVEKRGKVRTLRLRTKTGVLCAALIIALAQPARPEWIQTIGPGNGYAVCLATHNADVFAGTVRGFYSTTHNGPAWNSMNSILSSLFVSALAMIDSTIFAGTYGSGVYRSVDKGVTWTPVSAGLKSFNVVCFTVHDNVLFAGNDSGVFWTADKGASGWSEVTTKPSCRYANALAVWDNHLYIGSSLVVVCTGNTTDGWTITSSKFLANALVTSFARIGQNLFAATCHGVFCSIDSGIGWTQAWTGMPVDTVSTLLAIGTCLFAGANDGWVFRTTDNGANWTSVNEGLADSNVFALVQSSEFLFAATVGAGVWWRPLSELVPLTKENNRPAYQNRPGFCIQKNNCVRYSLPAATEAVIRLFDIHGRLIRVLLNSTQGAGSYTVTMPPDLSPGRYVVSFRAGDIVFDRAIVVVK
jgi:photosystem II stability/assembly factor-like uncharacterized protein